MALAGVLLRARVHAALLANALTAGGGQADALGQGRLGGEFAVGFGNDLVAHGTSFNEKSNLKPLLGHS